MVIANFKSFIMNPSLHFLAPLKNTQGERGGSNSPHVECSTKITTEPPIILRSRYNSAEQAFKLNIFSRVFAAVKNFLTPCLLRLSVDAWQRCKGYAAQVALPALRSLGEGGSDFDKVKIVTKGSYKKIFSFIILVVSMVSHAHPLSFKTTPIDDTTYEIQITIPVKPGTYLYKDYLQFSCNDPAIQLTPWKTSHQAINQYDPYLKETKKVFTKDVTITLQAKAENFENSSIQCGYLNNDTKKIIVESHAIKEKKEAQPIALAVEAATSEVLMEPEKELCPQTSQECKKKCSFHISDYISNLIQQHDSLAIRFLLVLILGLLMSLTPCIYPMIPITVGILQGQSSPSLFKNFLVSFSYTMGISSTFAFLGLLAAFTGQLFGSFMQNPYVIGVIIIILIYLALSMFGFYEMYIPRRFQSSQSNLPSGTFVSAFLFGMASGTVASPCLSPGLVLLLSLVTTLGSKIIGFILLFAFGLGLSIPLLLIGTFSSSLSVLPRAGQWMNEIKTIFGFILLGMCFYFIKPLVPLYVTMIGITLLTLSAALFYLIQAQRSSSLVILKTLLGISLIALTVVLGIKTYLLTKQSEETSSVWHSDYEKAVAFAQKNNMPVFLAFSAPFCSICTAIDKTIFKSDKITCCLQNFCCVKLDGAQESTIAESLQKKYKVFGFPTYILIDPFTGQERARWGSEIYDMDPAAFAAQLNQHLQP